MPSSVAATNQTVAGAGHDQPPCRPPLGGGTANTGCCLWACSASTAVVAVTVPVLPSSTKRHCLPVRLTVGEDSSVRPSNASRRAADFPVAAGAARHEVSGNEGLPELVSGR